MIFPNHAVRVLLFVFAAITTPPVLSAEEAPVAVPKAVIERTIGPIAINPPTTAASTVMSLVVKSNTGVPTKAPAPESVVVDDVPSLAKQGIAPAKGVVSSCYSANYVMEGVAPECSDLFYENLVCRFIIFLLVAVMWATACGCMVLYYGVKTGYMLTRAIAWARLIRLTFLAIVCVAIIFGVTALAYNARNVVGEILFQFEAEAGVKPTLSSWDMQLRIWYYQTSMYVTFFLVHIAFVSYIFWKPINLLIRYAKTVLSLVRYRAGKLERNAGPCRVPQGSGVGVRTDVIIVSDLHITGPYSRTIEGDMEDTRMLRFLANVVAAEKPSAIVIAGDITDPGGPRAWEKAHAAFESFGLPIYAAPGNHDVHFGLLNTSPTRRTIFARIFNDSPIANFGLSYTDSDVRDNLDKFNSEGKRVGATNFPVLYEDSNLRLNILVFNSNDYPSESPISNAIGEIGGQLERAEKLLAGRSQEFGLFVVLHHHIFKAPTASLRENFEARFLTCLDADAVLDLAEKHNADAVIHGHKHMPYVRDYHAGPRTFPIISCGSALYQADGPCREEVIGPSCFGLTLDHGRLSHLKIIRDLDP